ncbi:transmembrane protein 43-like [Clavelina lepadiformis]|uniref:transmembrane protein 43-like n=1 Tax=Clavelina lepadiformis TaxID=159417 RepID=UPI004042B9D1
MGPGDAHKVTYRHKPGFLERVGQSCTGSLVGLVLFLASFCLLYYNEGLSVEMMEILDEALNEVIPLDLDAKSLSNGRLVHVSGLLHTNKVLGDPSYGVAVPCVKLHRKVEMYQWVEHSTLKEIDEGDEIRQETTYTYNTEWSSTSVKSRDFAEEFLHQNPKEIPYEGWTQVADEVFVEGVKLSTDLISKISWTHPIVVLPPPREGSNAVVHDKYYYHGPHPGEPEVGDVRIFYECSGISGSTRIAAQERISIIAMFRDGQFNSFPLRKGRAVEFLYRGSKSIQEIFDAEQALNTARTWLLRLVGFLLMFVGLNIMTRIIVTLVVWMPIVGNVLNFSVTLFNLTLAASLSLLTIALCWMWHRPLFATSIFGVSLLPWFLSAGRAKSTHHRR